MGEIDEAVGTVVEGGLFARAVDRANAGHAPIQPTEKGHFVETACLNCGSALAGPYCQQCGQKAHLHRTLGAFLHDLLHGALHFEGKTWRTLPELAFRPGRLTRRYIEGERRKFVSPMALFLFSIFLMFAVFQIIGISPPTDLPSKTAMQTGLTKLRAETEASRDALATELSAMEEGSEDFQLTERELAEAQKSLDTLMNAEEAVSEATNPATDNITGETGWAWLDKGLEKWRTNPSLMIYKMQANGYKFSWMLIPISIPFVWLLFAWRRKFKAYDHAIFVTYSIAFMSLLFIAVSLLIKSDAPEWLWRSMIAFIPPIHIYKQLRGTYELSRFSAIWRLLVLSIFIIVVLVLFVQLILLIGAL